MDNRNAILLVVLVSVGVPFWLAYAQSSQEVRVRWEVSIAAPPGIVLKPGQYHPAPLFTLVDRRQRSSPMPRQRSPELSSDQLLVVAIDAQGQEKEQVLLSDPRVLRAESLGPTGELRGEVSPSCNRGIPCSASQGSRDCRVTLLSPTLDRLGVRLGPPWDNSTSITDETLKESSDAEWTTNAENGDRRSYSSPALNERLSRGIDSRSGNNCE